MMESCGKPLLQHMIERLKRSKLLDDVVVATTTNNTDDVIVDLCKQIGCSVYRGSEDDVLLRVLEAAKWAKADIIVETTGDCPCIDWRHVDYLINVYMSGKYDFVANCTERSFPDGFDIRIFSTKALEYVNSISDNPADHEHVSIYFPRHPEKFVCYNWIAKEEENRPYLEITLDEEGDYKLIDNVYSLLYKDNQDFSCEDVIRCLENNPHLLQFVEKIERTIIE